MTSYQWLLFDADNTLFDFTAAESYALTCTLTHFSVPATAQARQCYHTANDALWKAFERGELSQQDILARRFPDFLRAMGIQGDARKWSDFYIRTLSGCSVLLPGAETLCRRAAEKYTLVLATNGVSSIQRSRLAHSPLAKYFGDRVFISGEMGVCKPDKAFFDQILSAIGARTQRGRVLVIGDSLTSDIQGAFNAKLDSLWVHWPTAKAGPIKPTYEVENLAQLSEFLNTHRMVPIQIQP